jgi:hypothetical protein
MNEPDNGSTTPLLACGAAAGPLYLLVGFGQALTREGFDVRRHALSLLSNGEHGWIQIVSFVVSGLLVIAGAIGVRRALRGGSGGTWAPILLGTYGIGLLGAGTFVADPAFGFPPGTEGPTGLTRHGVLHFVFGAIGFYALIGACFVLARRFVRVDQPRWAVFSVLTGGVFFVSFAAIASGSASPTIMLAFYAAVTLAWIWHGTTHLKLWREASGLRTLRPRLHRHDQPPAIHA